MKSKEEAYQIEYLNINHAVDDHDGMAGHAGYFYGSLVVANDGNPCHRRRFYPDELHRMYQYLCYVSVSLTLCSRVAGQSETDSCCPLTTTVSGQFREKAESVEAIYSNL